jgi:glycerol-3-phosphate O-acyltransferase/dihydroxyacetone phosphate acyltransferase
MGYEKYKENPLIVELKKSILGFHRELMELQIRDHQVAYARITRFRALSLLIQRLIRFIIFSAAVIPGTILFAPVFIAGKLISNQKSKEALAASSVKIEARDVLATWKILVALGLTPILYTLYSLIVTYFAYTTKLFGYQPSWLPLWCDFPLAYAFFAGMSYAALRFGEVAMDILKSMRPLIIALSPAHGHILIKLRERREKLVLELNRVINTLGPELFSDFNTKRIIPEGAAMGRVDDANDSDYFRSASGLTLSEPASPSSPTFKLQDSMVRTDSYTNLGSVGVFSSRPATPKRARSRSNSTGGANSFSGLQGFSPIVDQGRFDQSRKDASQSAATSSEELSKKIRGAMRERNARRRSESERGSGTFSSSGASTPDSRAELDGLTMTKKEA